MKKTKVQIFAPTGGFLRDVKNGWIFNEMMEMYEIQKPTPRNPSGFPPLYLSLIYIEESLLDKLFRSLLDKLFFSWWFEPYCNLDNGIPSTDNVPAPQVWLQSFGSSEDNVMDKHSWIQTLWLRPFDTNPESLNASWFVIIHQHVKFGTQRISSSGNMG